MKELSNVLAPNENEQRMTSREIAELTNKQHSHVKRDIENLEKPYTEVFGDASKFGRISYQDSMNRTKVEFSLNKSQALFVVSGYNIIIRAKIQKRWEELETAALQPKFDIPTTLSGALMLAAKQAEQIELQAAKIKEDAPKVEVAEQFLSSGDYTSMNSAAKIMGIGRNTLLKLLREKRVLISTKGVDWNTPYQKHMKYFKVIVDEIEVGDRVHVSKSTYVRPSGMDYIKKLIEK